MGEVHISGFFQIGTVLVESRPNPHGGFAPHIYQGRPVLAVHLFEGFVDRHPVDMFVEKCIGVRLTIDGVIHASQGDM